MRKGFTIHHNGPPARCVGKPHARCVAFWEAVRRYHTDPVPQGKDWSDIAYSFGVCPHGERLVGRGWSKSQWANGSDMVGSDDGDDSDWYTVLVFVGGDDSTDDEEKPTPEMVAATAALIAEGRRTGRCASRVLPHNAFKKKPCPGPTFEALARQWDNATLTVPQEDDMDPEVLQSKLDDLAADIKASVGAVGKQTAKFVTTGGTSGLFDPKAKGNEWMAGAVTLPNLLAGIHGVDVGEAEIAEALAVPVVTALLARLPDEVTDRLDFDDIKAAVAQVLGTVQLVPGAG